MTKGKLRGSRGCFKCFNYIKETMKSRVETTNISTADEKDYDGDGVYPIMSTDYVSFSIIHC